jgi:hypothetical protein
VDSIFSLAQLHQSAAEVETAHKYYERLFKVRKILSWPESTPSHLHVTAGVCGVWQLEPNFVKAYRERSMLHHVTGSVA